MRDLLGNKLSEGQMVYWIGKQMAGHIIKISDGSGLTVVGGAQKEPPHVVIAITVAVNTPDRMAVEDVALTDFLRVVDPRSEDVLAKLLENTRAPKA